MKTILNKTMKPLKISTGGGKFLYLGPGKTGQISDGAARSAPVRKLVKSKEIEVQGEDEEGAAPGRGGKQGAIPHRSHGHPQTTMVLPKGNR